MTLQNKIERVGAALVEALTVDGERVCEVYHYWRPRQNAPYCLWGEDGEDGALETSNHKAEQAIAGWVDYYTKTEFDSNVDRIQAALNAVEFPFYWRYDAVQYEDETGLIHHSWTWRTA